VLEEKKTQKHVFFTEKISDIEYQCWKKKKPKVCVFHRNDSRANEVVLGNEKVCVLKQMKILGLILDSKLNWYYQTVTAIEKANKAKQALRIISKKFSTQEMVK
jgi:hypothetical protein